MIPQKEASHWGDYLIRSFGQHVFVRRVPAGFWSGDRGRSQVWVAKALKSRQILKGKTLHASGETRFNLLPDTVEPQCRERWARRSVRGRREFTHSRSYRRLLKQRDSLVALSSPSARLPADTTAEERWGLQLLLVSLGLPASRIWLTRKQTSVIRNLYDSLHLRSPVVIKCIDTCATLRWHLFP